MSFDLSYVISDYDPARRAEIEERVAQLTPSGGLITELMLSDDRTGVITFRMNRGSYLEVDDEELYRYLDGVWDFEKSDTDPTDTEDGEEF